MHTQAASVPGLRPVLVSVFTRPAVGAADAEIKVHAVENPELTNVLP